jgi:hypothetical protein
MASVLSFGVLVCGGDEGDDQVLEGGEKLVRLLVFGDRCVFALRGFFDLSYVLGALESCTVKREGHESW